jgi:hypothetical protein
MRPDDLATLQAIGQAMAATNGYVPYQASDISLAAISPTGPIVITHLRYTFEMRRPLRICHLTPHRRDARATARLCSTCSRRRLLTAADLAAALCERAIELPSWMWLPVVGGGG